MPNFKTHIIGGITVFPFFYLIFLIIGKFIIKNDIIFTSNEISFAFALFVLGSDLPDVDHQKSLINRFFRVLVVIISVFYTFDHLMPLIKNYISDFTLLSTAVLIAGIIIGWAIGAVFNYFTKHRGVWHSQIFPIIFGLILFILNLNKPMYINIFYSLAIFTGYETHLILDVLPMFKGKE